MKPDRNAWLFFMEVTCKYCKKKIDKKLAVKIPQNKNKNRFSYFCSEECKKKYLVRRSNRLLEYQNDSVLYARIREFIGGMKDSFIQARLEKLPAGWTDRAVLGYLKLNGDRIKDSMSKIRFNSATHRANYFFAILNNNIQNFIDDEKRYTVNVQYFNDVPETERDKNVCPRVGKQGGLAYWIPWALEQLESEDSDG